MAVTSSPRQLDERTGTRTDNQANAQEYHKPCLTCVSCKKTVGPGSFQDHEGDVSPIKILYLAMYVTPG